MDEELITIAEARARLGVSKPKMSQLVKAGLFPIYVNPLDGREKLVRWSEVEEGVRRPIRLDAFRERTAKKAAA